MQGSVAGLEVDEIDIESEYDSSGKKSNVFGMFKGLIGQKELTTESMQPILEKYRYNLYSCRRSPALKIFFNFLGYISFQKMLLLKLLHKLLIMSNPR